MANERLIVRIAVLENLCVAALGLYLANVRNDPDFSKSYALLDALQQDGEGGIAHFPEPTRTEGAAVLRDLLNRVRQSLPRLHGGPPVQSH
jgi:hypothetical protein